MFLWGPSHQIITVRAYRRSSAVVARGAQYFAKVTRTTRGLAVKFKPWSVRSAFHIEVATIRRAAQRRGTHGLQCLARVEIARPSNGIALVMCPCDLLHTPMDCVMSTIMNEMCGCI